MSRQLPSQAGHFVSHFFFLYMKGVLVGDSFKDRMQLRQWGVHRPHVAGIAGQSDFAAQSVVLSGGYEDDHDEGDWFLYTGKCCWRC